MTHSLRETMGKFVSCDAAQPSHEPPFSLLLGASLLLTIFGIFVISCLALLFDARVGVVPGVVVCVIFLSWVFGVFQREAKRSAPLLAISLALILVLLCTLAAAIFYDKSFDGIWYHQAAILEISQGWNPLLEYSRGGKEHSVWIDHYPRLSWVVGAFLFDAAGKIEASKALTLVLGVAALMLAYSALIELGCSLLLSLSIALLVVFNPVVVNQVFTGYVDAALYLLLVIAAAAFPLLERFPFLAAFVLSGALALVVNVKFTALPYSFLVVATGLSLLIFSKSFRAAKLAFVVGTVALMFGVVLLGFRPYIINLINHGHIFYPIMGDGAIDIMTYNTPRAFLEAGYFWKLGASLFGHVDDGQFRGLMVPFFGLTADDLKKSVGHDVRVSGFGFLFGGVILASVVLFAFLVFVVQGALRVFLVGVAVSIVSAVAINPEAWWARYVPQLWLLPVLIGGVSILHRSRFSLLAGWSLLSLLAFNASVISGGLVFSNIKHVRKVGAQLDEISSVGRPVFLYADVFVALERRLQERGIKVFAVENPKLLPCERPQAMVGSFERAKYCQ